MRYRVDAAGRLLQRANAAGQSVALTRDAVGRVTERSTDGGSARVTFTYLARLHELPAHFADADAARSSAREVVARDATIPLDDAQAEALAAAYGSPADTTRLRYFFEYRTADRKLAQSSARRLP